MKRIVVEFKESYLSHSVRRECLNMTEEQVIKMYGLTDPDIEWYKFIYEE